MSSLLGAIDRVLERLFSKETFPPSLYSDDCWFGIVTGLFIGVIATASALSPETENSLATLGMMLAAVGVVRFITWRLDANE